MVIEVPLPRRLSGWPPPHFKRYAEEDEFSYRLRWSYELEAQQFESWVLTWALPVRDRQLIGCRQLQVGQPGFLPPPRAPPLSGTTADIHRGDRWDRS